jgi:hypothetical protein
MYEAREDLVTHLRVHAIPGVMDLTLLKPGVPLTWYNAANPDGVPVDGEMDNVGGAYSPWQLVESEWGSYLKSYSLEQDILPGADPAGYIDTFYVDSR